MQNSLLFNDAVRQGHQFYIPRKPIEEVKLPGIKPQHTIQLSERDMEFNMHDRLHGYTPFKIIPIPQRKKRRTGIHRARNAKSVK